MTDIIITAFWMALLVVGLIAIVADVAGWLTRRRRTLHLVFDRMPDHDGARFIEAEDSVGKSLNAGEWRNRPDGLVELVIAVSPKWKRCAADLDFVRVPFRTREDNFSQSVETEDAALADERK